MDDLIGIIEDLYLGWIETDAWTIVAGVTAAALTLLSLVVAMCM